MNTLLSILVFVVFCIIGAKYGAKWFDAWIERHYGDRFKGDSILDRLKDRTHGR